MPFMLKSTIMVIEIFALTLALSLPLGLPVALGSNSKIKPIAWLCKAYVFVFRGTPLMLQLWFFYFFFPFVLKVQVSAFLAVIVAFVLNYGAYFAEIYRGGINSVDGLKGTVLRGMKKAACGLQVF